MIRYDVTPAILLADIKAQSPTWLDRAKTTTAQFKKLGQFDNTMAPFWSEIKPVFMTLQGDSKCAYCERKLESIDFGKAEQDVEHFRPKGNVKAWKPSKALLDAGVPITAPTMNAGGYFLLPYQPFNYGAACKPCNSALKSDQFPIAGKYRLKATDPTKMAAEKAYLIYPIGSIDDDPEVLIEFEGASPRPVAASGHRRNRALVTIEFFGLDDSTKRKNLFLERARLIAALFGLLETAGAPGPSQARAQAAVSSFQGPKAPHSNCTRSFVRLFSADKAKARALADAALDLVISSS